jgi:hypothetical protein
MKTKSHSLAKDTSGKIGWILLWLVGVPVPVLLVLFLLRGCT